MQGKIYISEETQNKILSFLNDRSFLIDSPFTEDDQIKMIDCFSRRDQYNLLTLDKMSLLYFISLADWAISSID